MATDVDPAKKIGNVRIFSVVLVLMFFRVIAIIAGLVMNPATIMGVANTRKIIFSTFDNIVLSHRLPDVTGGFIFNVRSLYLERFPPASATNHPPHCCISLKIVILMTTINRLWTIFTL